MINVNNKKLCENCFAEITASPCPICGFDRAAYRHDPITLELGSVLNKRYLIGHVIGKGGFGITYLAYDLKLDSKIAIKEYYPMGVAIRNPGSMKVSVSNEQSEESFKSGAEKFYNEAKLVAKFNGNPNIVSVHDFFYENDTVYFTMGYLQGETLKSYLQRSRLTPGQAVRVMQDISNALLVSHSMNILHRDVSPDNIMLCDDGTIKLLDFGAARQVMAEQSQSLSVILKQGYAPLEQYQKRGKQGPWTDIYALGATIYNALTGVSIDDPMTRLEDDSEFASNKYDIDESLWQIIKKCMMVKIADRYQDVAELKKDLNSIGIQPEPITDVDVNAAGVSGYNTARSSERSGSDDNATELLEDGSKSARNNMTMALSPQAAASYGAKEPSANKQPARRRKRSRINKTAVVVFALITALILALIAGVVILVLRYANNNDRAAEVVTEVATAAADSAPEDEAAEDTEESASAGIHRGTVYATVFGVSKSAGFGHGADAKVRYYLTEDDYTNDTNGDDAYMAVPNSAHVGNNYILDDVNIKDYADMDHPVITYFGIEIIRDTGNAGSDEKEAVQTDETGKEAEKAVQEEDEPAQEYTDDHEYFVVKAPDGYVNLRTGPGTDYDVITPIKNGEFIRSLDEEAPAKNGKMWVKVAWYDDGHVEGWVIGSQVQKVTE